MTINDELAQYAKDNTKYLKLNPGESYVGYFVGFKRVPDRFRLSEDPKATTIVYSFKDGDGRVLEWTRNSGKVAADMATIPIGSPFSITMIKKGEYLIQKIENGKRPAKVQAPPPAVEEEAPLPDINDENVAF